MIAGIRASHVRLTSLDTARAVVATMRGASGYAVLPVGVYRREE